MRRREFIFGLAMLANVGRASAQAVRVVSGFSFPSQVKVAYSKPPSERRGGYSAKISRSSLE
jgi:hypothetical protein